MNSKYFKIFSMILLLIVVVNCATNQIKEKPLAIHETTKIHPKWEISASKDRIQCLNNKIYF